MASLSNVRWIAACVTIGIGLTLSARPADGQPSTPTSEKSARSVHCCGSARPSSRSTPSSPTNRDATLTDLTPDDFELHQDGRKQKITQRPLRPREPAPAP